jgi:hypothetical protein
MIGAEHTSNFHLFIYDTLAESLENIGAGGPAPVIDTKQRTNVFWAGNVANVAVVSIFNNPVSEEGNSKPLTDRFNNLSNIYVDSRFKYISLESQFLFTYNYANVSAGNSGNTLTTVAYHNLGYPPAAIMIDIDTREVLTNSNYIQIINYDSYRTISLLIDSEKFYIKENYNTITSNLPSMTRRYNIFAFTNTADSN